MPSVTAIPDQLIQQTFVGDIRKLSERYDFPMIAGGDDGAVPPPVSSGGDGAGVQPAAGQGEPQGSSQGGSQGSAKGDGGFNWGLFPDVPEEQRALLEPHLKNVQGHVTKLEQQFSPFKPFAEQGITPDLISGYVNLDQAFAQDPAGTWIHIARQMQQQGQLSNDLDLDAVASILSGEDLGEGGEPSPETPQGSENPELNAALEKIAALEERLNSRDQQEQATAQEQLLNENLGRMRTQLVEAGIGEDALSEELLIGQIMAARGDIDKATKNILDFRQSQLAGYTQKAKTSNNNKELDLPNGLPKSPDKIDESDSWSKARAGAEHHLKQAIASSGN